MRARISGNKSQRARALNHHWRHTRSRAPVRLRMTLWNVAAPPLILGALGGVMRYKLQGDRFATVDRILAERAHAERPIAEQCSDPKRDKP